MWNYEVNNVWSYTPTVTLAHYASKYYDPEKAHQYYEEHKQLKGRKASSISTSGLNEKGKEAASYVKKTVEEERKEEIERKREEYNNSVNEYTTATKRQIIALKIKMKHMTKEQLYEQKGKIAAEIAKLREGNAAKRQELLANYEKEYGDTNSKYESTLYSELSSLVKDPNFQKVKKTSSKKTSEIDPRDYEKWVADNIETYRKRHGVK